MAKKSSALIDAEQRIRELQEECSLRDLAIASMARGDRPDVLVAWTDQDEDEHELRVYRAAAAHGGVLVWRAGRQSSTHYLDELYRKLRYDVSNPHLVHIERAYREAQRVAQNASAA